MTSILDTMTPTTAKAVISTAEYLETLGDLSKMRPDATFRQRALKRFAELRAFTLAAVKSASFAELPMDLAQGLIKERKAHRAFWEKKRRERLEARLAAATPTPIAT
jgi:hypothetical protein